MRSLFRFGLVSVPVEQAIEQLRFEFGVNPWIGINILLDSFHTLGISLLPWLE